LKRLLLQYTGIQEWQVLNPALGAAFTAIPHAIQPLNKKSVYVKWECMGVGYKKVSVIQTG